MIDRRTSIVPWFSALLILMGAAVVGCAKKGPVEVVQRVKTDAKGQVSFHSKAVDANITIRAVTLSGVPLEGVQVRYLVSDKHVLVVATDASGGHLPGLFLADRSAFRNGAQGFNVVPQAYAFEPVTITLGSLALVSAGSYLVTVYLFPAVSGALSSPQAAQFYDALVGLGGMVTKEVAGGVQQLLSDPVFNGDARQYVIVDATRPERAVYEVVGSKLQEEMDGKLCQMLEDQARRAGLKPEDAGWKDACDAAIWVVQLHQAIPEVRIVEAVKLVGATAVGQADRGTPPSDDARCIPRPIVRDGKLGYIDSTGRVLIGPRFAPHYRMSEFYEGLACVSETDGEAERWGYIDVTGKWAIPPQYDMAERFSGGYAVVQPPANSDSSAGRSRVRVTFIDRLGHATGSVHVDTTDGLGCYPEFSDGLVAVRRDGRWGFVDHMGHQVIDARFDRFCPPVFSSGRAVVRENGRLIAIDRTGRTAFVFDTAKYGCDPPYGFGEGLAMVIDRRSQRLGYIDTTGRLVIPCVFSPGVDRFNVIGGFHEGLAPAALKRRVGFINKAGDFVVEPKFAYAERYSEGTAVTFAGLPNAIVVFIGRNGKCTGAPKVDVPLYEKPNEVLSWEWGEFKGGLVRLGKGRKASYFDRRGRMVSAVWLDDSVAHGAVHSAGSEGFAESQSRSAPTVQVDSSGPGGSPAVVPFWKTERKPVPIDIPVPDYPAAARKAGVQGQAVVEALVDVDGSVADARILKSAGDQSLDLAGLATARRAKFRPACYRGAIVRCWVSIPFRFKP